MKYSLTNNSHSYFTVKKHEAHFELIPNTFFCKKWFPNNEKMYIRVIIIGFRWLIYDYEFILRTKQ